ncbi:hypothetical protein Y1Q_0007950 [Alligator mississippiensis]|uniref:Uncharacterized protein n=1 Tax=Alligator mississippiensis TaxID=8496 RepID=A0A151NEX2_ALLMI|nr:hypothetical protein Y1Q_0007950 [Alligator mississippiensis]
MAVATVDCSATIAATATTATQGKKIIETEKRKWENDHPLEELKMKRQRNSEKWIRYSAGVNKRSSSEVKGICTQWCNKGTCCFFHRCCLLGYKLTGVFPW